MNNVYIAKMLLYEWKKDYVESVPVIERLKFILHVRMEYEEKVLFEEWQMEMDYSERQMEKLAKGLGRWRLNIEVGENNWTTPRRNRIGMEIPVSSIRMESRHSRRWLGGKHW